MNTITKHTNVRKITALGITGAAASALIIGGFVAPAQALDGDNTTTSTSTDSSSEQNRLDIIGALFNLSGNDSTGNGVLGNDTSLGGVGNGGLVNGGVANGGVANGGVVDGPLVNDSLNSDIGDVASGNEVGNGNDVVAPIDAPVTAPVDAGNGTDVDSDVGSVDVEDIDGSVDSIVNDVLGDLGLGR